MIWLQEGPGLTFSAPLMSVSLLSFANAFPPFVEGEVGDSGSEEV